MVARRKTPKLSSQARKIRAKMESLDSSEQMDFYKANRDAFQELEEYEMRAFDRKLLLETANLHDAGWQRFFRTWLPSLNEKSVYSLRDSLRAIWEKKSSVEETNSILTRWLVWNTKSYAPEFWVFPWSPDIRTGRLLPNPRDLPVRLVMAVLEHFPGMAKCANPECVVPYFIAKRKSQRFCELGECTRYAQNQYALKWWREKHQSQTATPERGKRGSRKAR